LYTFSLTPKKAEGLPANHMKSTVTTEIIIIIIIIIIITKFV